MIDRDSPVAKLESAFDIQLPNLDLHYFNLEFGDWASVDDMTDIPYKVNLIKPIGYV